MAGSLFVGRLLGALEFVDLGLQAFKFNAFRLQPLGFPLLRVPLLRLQAMRFDPRLAAALALQPLGLLGGGLAGGFKSLLLLSPGAFDSQSSSRGLRGVGVLGLAGLRGNSRLAHEP